MIDDALLEGLFRSAADSIAVPSDGPQSIRMARDVLDAGAAVDKEIDRPGPKPRRGVWIAVAAVMVSMIGVVAVLSIRHSGGSSPTAATATARGAAAKSAIGPGGLLSKGNTETHQAIGAGGLVQGLPPSGVDTPRALSQSSYSAAAAPAAVSTSGASAGSSVPNEVPVLPSKVIETGSISLQIADGKLETVMGSLTDLATAEGGFVASSSTNAASSAPGGSPASGSITVRVPVARYSNLLDQVRALGTVLSATTSGQDVTSQYVDLQARIQSLTDTRTQFEQILAKAYSIGDILSVEGQISDLQTQIEQLQGQLQVLQDQTSYSTLAIQVTEVAKQVVVAPPKAPKPPSGISKAWARARHSFSHGVEAVIAASGGIAVFLLFASLVALVGRIGWLRLRRYLV